MAIYAGISELWFVKFGTRVLIDILVWVKRKKTLLK